MPVSGLLCWCLSLCRDLYEGAAVVACLHGVGGVGVRLYAGMCARVCLYAGAALECAYMQVVQAACACTEPPCSVDDGVCQHAGSEVGLCLHARADAGVWLHAGES